MISQGDFSGMGTATMPFRMVQFLAEGVLETGKWVRGKMRESRQRRLGESRQRRLGALVPLSGAPGVVAALDRAVVSGRLASSSARKYREVIVSFAAGMKPAHPDPVGPGQVERFLEDRDLRGIGCGARRVDLAALRTVFDKLLGNHVTAGLSYPERPNPVPASRPGEVGKMFAAASDDRDRLLLLLLNAAKLRPGQIASLTPVQIDRKRGAITVPKRKPAEFVEILLPECARKLLNGLLAGHEPEATDRRWLFTSPRHPEDHLTVRAIQKRLRQLAANCGVDATPTRLRKADSLWSTSADGPRSLTVDRPTSEITRSSCLATPRPKSFSRMGKHKMPPPTLRRHSDDCALERDNRPVSSSRRRRTGVSATRGIPIRASTGTRPAAETPFSDDFSIGKHAPQKWQAHQRNVRMRKSDTPAKGGSRRGASSPPAPQ